MTVISTISNIIFLAYYPPSYPPYQFLHSDTFSHRVLVLDQGRVAEFDTPARLLADPNSVFYGMAKDAGLV